MYAAKIVVPKVGAQTGMPGTFGPTTPGAMTPGLTVPGLETGAPTLGNSVLPTFSSPLLLTPAGADPALALPVSRSLVSQGAAPKGMVIRSQALPSLAPVTTPNPITAPRVTTSGRILPQTVMPKRAVRKAPLLKALSLPSLFKGGVPSDANAARALGEKDFQMHMGGDVAPNQASIDSAEGPSIGSLEQGSAVSAEYGASGLVARIASLPIAMRQAASNLPNSMPSGLMVLQNPNGQPSVLDIAHADGTLVAPSVRKTVEAAAQEAYSAENAAMNAALRKFAPASDKVLNAADEVPAPKKSASRGWISHPLSRIFSKETPLRRYRSAYFPVVLVTLSAGALALAWGLPALVSQIAPLFFDSMTIQSVGGTQAVGVLSSIFQWAFLAFGATTALAAIMTVWELVLFKVAVATGRSITDDEFWKFARKELSTWDLHPSVLASLLGTGPGHGIIKLYRPANKYRHLAFAFAQGGSVYIRPELARYPWLFRWVVKHELFHYKLHQKRGPPPHRSQLMRLVSFIFSEVGARVDEVRPLKSLKTVQIPVLQRVLEEARVSLKLKHPYDTLIIHPGNHETRSPEEFKQLSGGVSNIVRLKTAPESAPADSLKFQAFGDSMMPLEAAAVENDRAEYAPEAEGIIEYLRRQENKDRFRVVVYPQSFGAIPEAKTPENGRLAETLHKLDEIHFMKQRLEAQGSNGFDEGTADAQKLDTLSGDLLGRLVKNKANPRKVDNMLEQMMLQVVRSGLKGLEIADVLESLYRSTRDKGVVLLPFAPGEPNLDTVQRILRYWQAADGGEFLTERIDLPEGGHVIVARKVEPRVDLWLDAKEGGSIDGSFTRTFNQTRSEQESYLSKAGFSEEELEKFRNAGLVVKHVFGPGHGERIFVSVHRRHAKELRKYGDEAGIHFGVSRGGYQLHLTNSAALQRVDKVNDLGLTGKGGKIYDIDTGLDVTHPDFADRDLKSVDFVDEGWEDWIGHGTHKAGISYAGGTIYKGMAPEAEGRMGKVFAQNGFGANDGDIMAAAVDAMQWGADVISLSLGSRGTVDAPLAQFFSDLTLQKNANGEYPIVTGSAGNSGPFNDTRSQPSTGERVATTPSATKSLDDGIPEMSFFSSVGQTLDKRWSRKRYRRPFGITALGGDVTTPPNVTDVYSDGIESSKSKDMAAGPSDSRDGKGVRMSGTSMSNPMVAGLALLVKQGIQRVLKKGSDAAEFFAENLPFVVNLVMMRSSKDMRVPIAFQEAGYIDGLAAIELGAKTFGGLAAGLPRRLARAGLRMLGMGKPATTETISEKDETPWDWISRAKRIWDLENRVYEQSEAAKIEALAKLEQSSGSDAADENEHSEDPMQGAEKKNRIGDEANGIYMRAFKKARAEARDELLRALKDDVWLVRMYAAFAFLNFKDPAAVDDLMEVALTDSDGRVRQTAFLAIAEVVSYQVDEALKQALSNEKADIRIYAAYALARHGDGSGIDRIIAQTRSDDKKLRHTAVWLLGQLGRRAPPEAAEALASRVDNQDERGNIQHLSVASLTEIAMANPKVVTSQTMSDLLDASGPQNFALTRTISKFFVAAVRSSEVRDRMQRDPLQDRIVTFIHKHKASVNRPGALGQMVTLLAKVVNVSLDMPTPIPNPTGTAVPGVDADLGPVHLIVEMPREGTARIEKFQDFRNEGEVLTPQSIGSFGLEADVLSRHNARVQTAMPMSQSLWVEMPAPKVMAFKTDLEMRGYTVRRAAPMYRLTHDTKELGGMPAVKKSGLTGKGVLVVYLDEGGDPDHPAITPERVSFKRNFIDGEGGPEDVEAEGVSHGTHGMGIVGGTSVEGSPYEGMAPGVNFAIGKVLGQTGGSEATVMAGLEWAASLVENPLKTPVMVNLSLGGPGSPDNAIGRLVNKLRLMNIGVVVAAGNSGPTQGTVSSPANAALAISVAAVDKSGKLAEYSSRGRKGDREISWADIGGGVFFDRPNPYEIVSALNTRLAEASKGAATAVEWLGKTLYHYMSGTSMAAPHTTGKLADLVERMQQKMPVLPNGYLFWLEDLVARTASQLEGEAESAVGAGLIDLEKALAELDDALEDPETVANQSQALYEQAQLQAGDASAPITAPEDGGGWFKRNSRMALHSFLWLPLAGMAAIAGFLPF